MRRVIWTCDRCGTEVEVPQRIDIHDIGDFPAYAQRDRADLPRDWVEFVYTYAIEDVCARCVTAEEHADRALHDARLNELHAVEMDGAFDSPDEDE